MFVNIEEELKEKKEYLQKLIETVSKECACEPDGSIWIRTKTAQRAEYYYVPADPSEKERYLSSKDEKLICSLLQKRYNHLVLKRATELLKSLDTFLGEYDQNAIINVLNEFKGNSQKFLKLYEYPNDVYAKQWQSKEYDGNNYPFHSNEFVTNKGELVRSKSELIIANCLKDAGVPYRYEYPYVSSTFQKVYPDFTVLNVRTREEYIWEHFGRIDGEEYRANFFRKMNLYSMDGVVPGKGLIVTFEDYHNPINIANINKQIKEFLI